MIVYFLCYSAAVLFARTQYSLLSGTALLFAALVLFCREKRRNGGRENLLALFSLSFVGGEGISCLKLSYLQGPWAWQTFAAFFLAYSAFRLAFRFASGTGLRGGRQREGRLAGIREERLFFAVIGLSLASFAAFLIEARILGFVPFLVRHMPHAYSYFHVSGLHYLTVSCVLVPSLALIDRTAVRHRGRAETVAVAGAVVLSLLIPVLCVSRFQLLLAVLMAAFTWLTLRRDPIPGPLAVLGFGLLLAAYGILSMARGHSVSYLNGIFEMKRHFPIFVSQPYIYIANNYDNVNCLIRELPQHSFGLKMLFPLIALSGLKFLRPELTAFPLYVTKTELTTVTLIYDAWYDFGILGVVAFCALLGFVAARLEKKLREQHSPVFCMFYAQFSIYIMLSFFTTWFSNPATWVYFLETGLIAWFIGGKRQWG